LGNVRRVLFLGLFLEELGEGFVVRLGMVRSRNEDWLLS
jgi:hypothetical protein